MNYKSHTLVLLLLTIGHCITAQNFILKEEFDNNLNEWPFIENGDTHTAAIADGELTWTNNSDSYQSTYVFVNEDWEKNFKISTRLKWVKGRENNFLGFYFSANSKRSTGHRFGISNNGFWTMETLEDNKITYTSKWTPTSLVKAGEYNDLEVRKLGNEFFFSLNGEVVHYMRGLQEKGDYSALNICDSATASFDSFIIEETTEEKNELAVELNKYLSGITKEEVLLNEDFNDNSNEWPYIDATSTSPSSISNGQLVWHNQAGGYSQKTKKVPINWSLDFDIETKLKRLSGKRNNIYGMMFDFEDWDNHYYFGYAPTGYFIVYKEINNEEVFSTGWKKSEFIKGDGDHILKVEKIGNQLFFFINNKMVHSIKGQQHVGDYQGLLICDSAMASYDYFRIAQYYHTEKEQENLLKKILPKTSDKSGEAESMSDKKHRKHTARLIEKWRGKPVAVLRKEWGTPYYSSAGAGSSSGRYFYKYKILNGKQTYYQINYFSNGGKYGPVVNDIYLSSNTF